MSNQKPNLEEQFNQVSQPAGPSLKPKFNVKYMLIAAILAVLLIGGILAYQYWWLPKQERKSPETNIQDQTANYSTYSNAKYGFSIVLPSAWLVAKEIEGNDTLPISSYIFVKESNYERYKDDFATKLIVPIQSQVEIIVLQRNWTSVKDMDVTDYLAIPIFNEVSLKELKKESLNGIDFYFYKMIVDDNGTQQTGIVWNSDDARYDLFTFRAPENPNLERILKQMAMSFTE